MIVRGGEESRHIFFVLLHCYFSLKSHIYGLKWRFWSSIVCIINNPKMFNFVVGQFWSKVDFSLKYFSFCCIIFEEYWFLTKMYNMHIKWKQKTCRIQLWHLKNEICYQFLGKNNIFTSILTKFFFEILNFRHFFYLTPKIHTLH